MAQHNYRGKLLSLIRADELNKFKPGVLYHLDFYHDDWCAVFRGGVCDCNPDVRVRENGSGGQQEAQAGETN